MPQGEIFWNPYRLIPVRENVEREAPWTDERFGENSGLIQCTLENLTPLFIGAQSAGAFHPPFIRNDLRKRGIPGSSLKGMLRSLAEIVGGGCFLIQDKYNPTPSQMRACEKVKKLCISCRMFGAMERGSNARVHKGKVGIGDAVILEDKIQTTSLQVLLNNNGLRHEPFYRSQASGVMDGNSRKLYFHQPQRKDSTPPIAQQIRDRAWNIDALLPGHHFSFEVQFTSLTDDEFPLLLYVLALENQVEVVVGEEQIRLSGPMRHKVGNAKPLGLGSCHIKINKMILFPPPSQRFTTMAKDNDQVLEGENLERTIQERTDRFITDNSPTMQALRKMMVWDESDQRDFHYPGYEWFRNTTNSGTRLKKI